MTLTPNGCRWCGKPQREHGIEYAEGAGYHVYQSPSVQTMLERMKERRASRAG